MWLQVSVAGGLATALFAPDSRSSQGTWVVMGTTAAAPTGATYVGILSANFNANAPSTATFDNVALWVPTCSLPLSLAQTGFTYAGSGCAGPVTVPACSGLSCAVGYGSTPALTCAAGGSGTFDLTGCSGMSARAVAVCACVWVG